MLNSLFFSNLSFPAEPLAVQGTFGGRFCFGSAPVTGAYMDSLCAHSAFFTPFSIPSKPSFSEPTVINGPFHLFPVV